MLYAMWSAHSRCSWSDLAAAWVGLIVVVQNFISSSVNSHLFDFDRGMESASSGSLPVRWWPAPGESQQEHRRKIAEQQIP